MSCSNNADAELDLTHPVWEVKIEYQPPAGSASLTPVHVVGLKLVVGREVDVRDKRLYLALSRSQLHQLSSEILRVVPKPSGTF